MFKLIALSLLGISLTWGECETVVPFGTSLGANGGTSAAVNTTGINFFALKVGWWGSPSSPPSVRDSYGNTLTALTAYGIGGDNAQILYAQNAAGGPGHTWTVTAPGMAPTIEVLACSGMATSGVFRVGSDQGNATAGNCTTPPVSPQRGDLVFTGVAWAANAAAKISAGFTPMAQEAFVSGVSMGGAAAHIYPVVSAGPVAPTWEAAGYAACAVAVFAGGSVAAPGTPAIDSGIFTLNWRNLSLWNTQDCVQPDNTRVDHGMLTITSIAQTVQCGDQYSPLATYNYTSGSVISNIPPHAYGVLEYRAKFADISTIHPTIWLNGINCYLQTKLAYAVSPESPTCNWPAVGADEIDMTERINGLNQQIHTAGHSDGCNFPTPYSFDLTSWHDYRLEWSPGLLVWKVDGTTFCTVSASYVPSSPMFVLITQEVDPGTVTGLPATTAVDWFRWCPVGTTVCDKAHATIYDEEFDGDSSQSDIYIGQSFQGQMTGTDAADSFGILDNVQTEWPNNPGYWTNGQIGPGTTLHFTGALTTQPHVYGSGTAAQPIQLVLEPGATLPSCIDTTGFAYVIGNATCSGSGTPPPAVPFISSLSPSSATAGGATFTLTIIGSNFLAGATASWGATPLPTSFVTTTQLNATVPASLISTAGTFSVTVTTSNGASNPAAFTVLPPPSSTSATFITLDTTTQGNWRGVYGANGYNIINDAAAYPAYATVTPSGNSNWTWASSTSDVRALTRATFPPNRIAACWYSPSSFTVDLPITDSGSHRIALYVVDWDSRGRSETITLSDFSTGAVLDSRSVSGFVSGDYLVWQVSGHLKITITRNSGDNVVLSGVLFQ